MAKAAYDFRDANQDDCAYYPLVANLKAKGYHPKILELELLQEAPDTAAEIRVSYTNLFDGTASPVKVDLKSADAADTSAGTGARTVKVFGIGASAAAGTFKLIEETVTLTGTDAVTTTNYWKRLILMKVATAGSGGVAAGAITCHEVGGTTNTYMTIALGDLCSINSRIYIPTGYSLQILMTAMNVNQATGAAAADLDEGATTTMLYQDGLVTWPDVHIYSIVAARSGTIPRHWETRTGSDSNYIAIKHATINTAKNKTVHYDQLICIWPNTAALRGLA